MKAKEILDIASRLVSKDRNESYGDAKSNFGFTAILWSAWLGHPVEAKDVAAMMALLKLARSETGEFNPDSYIDGAGYIALMGEVSAPEKN